MPSAAAHALYAEGHLHAEHWRFEEADRVLERAAALDPGDAAIESVRALVKQELGDTAGAIAALERAARRDPADLRGASGVLLLPQVYDDAGDLAGCRARYAAGLAALVARQDTLRAESVLELDRGNFLLAYQGEDDLELQRAYSGLLAALAARVEPRWREPKPVAFDGGRRLRVGFCGGIFRECTAGRYFERWVTGLDPARFERIVFHTGPVSDAFTASIASRVDRFEALRAPARETIERLEAERLDVLVHPEVGMDAMTYLLAAVRVAPVQCAGWGHPVTTGSDAVDAYFTCGAMEPPGAAAHYAERLVPLPGIGVDYAMPPPPEPARRADFSLPEGRRLYACPQSLFKIHPEMDALLAGVLAEDPLAVLVLFQAPARGVTHRFAARLQRALDARGIDPRGQVKFLPRLDGRSFRRVLSLCDVVLDPVRWSGGNTSLDAFAAGTPVVTWPGRFMRARQTAAMLGMMGLEALVATDAADYVARAVAAAKEPAWREAVRTGRGAVFDRPEPVAAFAEALLSLGAGERRGTPPAVY